MLYKEELTLQINKEEKIEKVDDYTFLEIILEKVSDCKKKREIKERVNQEQRALVLNGLLKEKNEVRIKNKI